MDIPIDLTFEIQLFSNDHILRNSVRKMVTTKYLKKNASPMFDVNLI